MSSDFEKRISHNTKLEIIDIKDSNIQSEGNRITTHLGKNPSFNIAMSEEGEKITSQGLALLLQSRSEPITFIIGGPKGLADVVKQKANMILSLSTMTFTHEMVKMFLLEQIYRAISILEHRKYHKD